MGRFIRLIFPIIMTLSLCQCHKEDIKTGKVKEVTEKGTVVITTEDGEKADKNLLDNYSTLLKEGYTIYYTDRKENEVDIKSIDESLLGASYGNKELEIIHFPSYSQLKEIGNRKVFIAYNPRNKVNKIDAFVMDKSSYNYICSEITGIDFDYLYLGDEKIDLENVYGIEYKK